MTKAVRRPPKRRLGVNQIYCPESLDLTKIMPAKEEARFLGKVAHLMHTLRSQAVFNADKTFETFTRLRMELLRNTYGDRAAKEVVDLAVKYELIERDLEKNYWAGHYSKGFRLHPRFWTWRWRWAPITDKRFVDRLQRLHRQKRRKISTRADRHLERFLRQIEVDPAIHDVMWAFNETYDRPAIEAIQRGAWRYDIDSYGRRHTNLTNLFSVARMFLRWRGQSLWNVDIANSQPLFIGILARDYHLFQRQRLASMPEGEKEEEGREEGREERGRERKEVYVVRYDSMTSLKPLFLQSKRD